MAIMVLGGSGFVGSHLVRKLSEAHMSVISYDLVQDSSSREDLKAVRADILDLGPIDLMFFDHAVDCVIHVVGLPVASYCERNPHLSYQLNVASVQTTLEAMRKADVKRLVFASTAALYKQTTGAAVDEHANIEPSGIYGRHKLMAEKAIEAYAASYGLQVTVLRLFNVYGGNPSMRNDVLSIFMRNAANGGNLEVRGPSKFRDFVHIDDVCSAFVAAASKNIDGTINVGAGERTSLLQLANLVRKSFRRGTIRIDQTEDDGQGLVADNRRAVSLLGFQPRTSMDGISAHIASWMNELVSRSRSQSVKGD